MDILIVSLLPLRVKLTSWLSVVELPPLINTWKPVKGAVGGKEAPTGRPPPPQLEVVAETVEE
jgi:hypothetical protein